MNKIEERTCLVEKECLRVGKSDGLVHHDLIPLSPPPLLVLLALALARGRGEEQGGEVALGKKTLMFMFMLDRLLGERRNHSTY